MKKKPLLPQQAAPVQRDTTKISCVGENGLSAMALSQVVFVQPPSYY